MIIAPWFMRALTARWEKNLGLWSGSGGDSDGSEVSRLPSKTLTPGRECGRTNFIGRNRDEWEQMEVGIYVKCEDKNARQGWNIKQTKLVGINLQFMCWRMPYLYSMSYSCLVASYLQGTGTSKASFLPAIYFKSLSHMPCDHEPSVETLLGEVHVRTRVSKSVGLDVKQTFSCQLPSTKSSNVRLSPCVCVCVYIWRKSVTESTQQACGCVSDDGMMLHNQTSGDASYTVHFECTVQIQPESDFCFGVKVFMLFWPSLAERWWAPVGKGGRDWEKKKEGTC